MGWRPLEPRTYAGPLVDATLVAADVLRRGAHPDDAAFSEVRCLALLDTGASYSIVDVDRVAVPLALRELDRRPTFLAEHGLRRLAVHEVGVSFPGFDLPPRLARVSAARLPPPFAMLVGMDLLEGTRLALDLRPEGWWIRWEPTG